MKRDDSLAFQATHLFHAFVPDRAAVVPSDFSRTDSPGRKGQTRRVFFRQVLALAGVTAILGLTDTGCRPSPALTIYVLLDDSFSRNEMFAKQQRLLEQIDADCQSNDRLVIYGVDANGTWLAYDGQPHRSLEEATRFVAKEFRSTTVGQGTPVAEFYEDVRARAAEDKRRGVAIVISDGEDTGHAGGASGQGDPVRDATQALAATSQFAGVLLVGRTRDNGATVADELGPLDRAHKLRFWPESDIRTRAVLDAISQVRAGADCGTNR